MTSIPNIPPVTDLGYYFTDWIWRAGSTDFMKSMLLFFDGLTLSLPTNIAAEMIERDPILATPLAERHLLMNFDPASTLDTETAERLVLALTEAVEAGWLWDLTARSASLTNAHWGSGLARADTIKAFEHALRERGLMTPIGRDGLYQMAYNARLLVLTLFSQALRTTLIHQGLNLHLVSDSVNMDFYGYYRMREHYTGHFDYLPRHAAMLPDLTFPDLMDSELLSADLCDVGADLSAVPLDEVLDYRSKNGQHYRAYAKGLRELLISLGQANPVDRNRILRERSQEIRDQAADLRRMSRSAFGTRIATLLISLAGAAWTLHTGDPVGAMLAGAAAGLQAVPAEGEVVTTYSYLLRARDLGDGR